jgi:hypothetical protein
MSIIYPRKCLHCDYTANNPSMFHYHKQTHDAVPVGTYCHFGCGNIAIAKNTGGKYVCQSQYQNCPAYISQLSNRSKASWQNAELRKNETKKDLIRRLHNTETIDKMRETKRKKTGLITPGDIKSYRAYARRIRAGAQRWAKEQGYILGQQTLHVDHKLCILDAWHANLAIEIVNHPANLQILEAKENSRKGAKSSLTVDQLLGLIDD